MDKLTLIVLAANHPTACVIDWDDDPWHAVCYLRFVEEDAIVATNRHRVASHVPGSVYCYCSNWVGSIQCAHLHKPMTLAPEGPWTYSP